jgi:hypothetical protein
MVEINWLAVLAGTIGYQVLGALWYGPLFGARWMAAMGGDNQTEMSGEDPTMGYVLTAIGAFVAASALAIMVDWTAAATWQAGLSVGVLAGVGFVATTGLQAVPFEDRPWPVYLLSVGYNVLALAGIGVLLAIW